MKHQHHLFCACCISEILRQHSCPLNFRFNQTDLIRHFQPMALVTEHKGSMSTIWIQNVFWVSGIICSICGSSTSQNLSISHIPSEVAIGIYTSSLELRSPSFSLVDQTHLPTILRSFAVSYTSVSVFRCSPAFRFPNARTRLSFKSPPERGRLRKETERALIWLCNMVQFAIGQWNSISFPPFGQYPSQKSPQTLSFLSPQSLLFIFSHLLLVKGQNQIARGKIQEKRHLTRLVFFSEIKHYTVCSPGLQLVLM